MGLTESMMIGSTVANGLVGSDLGTALWLFLVVNLVASGLGIIAKAHRGRSLMLPGRPPKTVPLAAGQPRLCEVGSV